ncbi:hypothetical protein GDO81_006767 [Engystomops pustulosus]|uniref:Uncharacterized protein n=1 Tax=Engystomops pustulosus TaxID=76066 RepID=A0AAV7D2D5_ENGPU|nr:hypothetical protein GDO81_006767 [Engystomops pustulosus]
MMCPYPNQSYLIGCSLYLKQQKKWKLFTQDATDDEGVGDETVTITEFSNGKGSMAALILAYKTSNKRLQQWRDPGL